MRPIFYDTETTGVRPKQDRIIELAAYDPERDKTFCSFIHPGCPIPAEASAISHITDAMVADAPPFGTLVPSFLEFCTGDVVLIAHNNDAFDQPFLEAEFERAALPFPTQWKFFDTLKWSRKYRSDLPRHSLQVLRELFGLPANQAHRALDDVQTLHKVYLGLVDDLPIHKALALLSQPQVISRMPFGKHQGKPLADVPKDYVSWLSQNGALDKKENSSLKEAFLKLNLLPNV